MALGLFRLNTPEYFSTLEEKDLDQYLDQEVESYYLVELHNNVVGCGGINFEENRSLGKISWDIFHPDYKRQGLGTLLLKHRISELKKIETVNRIIVRTSQLASGFYQKAGFEIVENVKDYWAPGFDLVKMEYMR